MFETLATMMGPALSSGAQPGGFLSEMMGDGGPSTATATSGLKGTGSMTVTQGGSVAAQASESTWMIVVVGVALLVLVLRK